MTQQQFDFCDEAESSHWHPSAHIQEIPEGRGLSCEVAGIRLALFFLNGQLEILEGRCPHANAPLGRGWIEGDQVICPLHRWKFDIRTGQCLTNPQKSVRHFPSRVDENGIIWVDLSEAETLSGSKGSDPPHDFDNPSDN
jgi:nitrite reductase/ring-hydroxylating ferredoxin subunit